MANGGFKVTTRQTNPGWAKLIAKNIKGLTAMEVAFGFPQGGKAASMTYDNGFGVLDNAIVQQFGADIDHPGGTPYMIGKDGKAIFLPKNAPGAARLPKTKPHRIKIPARPFMDDASERVIADGAKDMAAVAEQANRREINAGQALKKIAAFGVRCTQEAITDGEYIPNAPSTIREKKSAKPLVDTGKMRQSVSSAIRERTD